MTNKERVLASFNHQQPDRIPYHVEFTQKANQKMAAWLGDWSFQSGLDNCIHFLSTEKKNAWTEVQPDIWEDEFGVQWNRTIDKDIGNVCNCMIIQENLNDYEFPDPNDPTRYENYEKSIINFQEKFIVPNFGFSFFERAWTLAGMETILMGMLADPKFVNMLFDRILEYNLKIIENILRYDVDAVMFGDDWGQQTGLIMGPRLWREFIKPRITQMYQAVKAEGKFVMIHSCGKVDEIFPDLIEAGVDCFNPFQPEVMDVYEIKKEYGDSLAFFGGISTQQTLPFATVQDVKDEVRRLLDQVGKNGGYIAAPAHSIPGDAKPENVAAMLEVLNSA